MVLTDFMESIVSNVSTNKGTVMRRLLGVIGLLALSLISNQLMAERIKDIATLAGVRTRKRISTL